MPISLIVGLGNPGAKYQDTRHNAGFWWLDQIATEYRQTFRIESKFHGEVCRLDGANCWLLKPTTFMNRSGQAVAAIARFYKIPVQHILVVHDELDFSAGTIRLKQGGGDGRHNGLKDIIAHLGNKDFLRLRVGIGHPGHRDAVANYVLSAPSKVDKGLIEAVLASALQQLPAILNDNLNQAMQVLHSAA